MKKLLAFSAVIFLASAAVAFAYVTPIDVSNYAGFDNTCATDSSAAFVSAETAAKAGEKIIVPAGTYQTVTGLAGTKRILWEADGATNCTGGLLNIGTTDSDIVKTNFVTSIGSRVIFRRNHSGPDQYATMEVKTLLDSTGGTAGFLNQSFLSDVKVSAGFDNDAVAGMFTLDNFSAAGAYFSLGGQFTYESGSGWGAAMVGDFIDKVGANNPTAGQVSLELDNEGNGTDNSGNGGRGSKVMLNLVGIKYNAAGALNDIGWGIWVDCANADDSLCHFKDVVDVDAPFAIGFDTSHGTQDTGGAAFRSLAGQDWELGSDSQGRVVYHLNTSNRHIEFLENSVVKDWIDLSSSPTVRYNTAQSSTPASPASGEANTYVKANKFIIQYNDAGTIRYKYLTLSGTGTTWTATTTAP